MDLNLAPIGIPQRGVKASQRWRGEGGHVRGPSYDEADSYLASTLLYDSALVCSPGAFAPARRRDVAHESGVTFGGARSSALASILLG